MGTCFPLTQALGPPTAEMTPWLGVSLDSCRHGAGTWRPRASHRTGWPCVKRLTGGSSMFGVWWSVQFSGQTNPWCTLSIVLGWSATEQQCSTDPEVTTAHQRHFSSQCGSKLFFLSLSTLDLFFRVSPPPAPGRPLLPFPCGFRACVWSVIFEVDSLGMHIPHTLPVHDLCGNCLLSWPLPNLFIVDFLRPPDVTTAHETVLFNELLYLLRHCCHCICPCFQTHRTKLIWHLFFCVHAYFCTAQDFFFSAK